MLKFYLEDLYTRLKLPAAPTEVKDNEKVEEKLHCTTERAAEIMKLPECQLYIYVLLIMKLIDDGDLNNVSNIFSLSPFLRLGQGFRRLRSPEMQGCQPENSGPHHSQGNLLRLGRLREEEAAR